MNIIVKGGTPDHSRESLCATCRFAHFARGFRESEEMVHCGAQLFKTAQGEVIYSPGHQPVPFRINSCTGYVDRRVPLPAEYEKNALIIDPKNVRINGFGAGTQD